MNPIVSLADAVVTQINSGSYDEPVNAERHYSVSIDWKTETGVDVLVVPFGIEETKATRELRQFDVQIQVAVLKKLQKVTNVALDNLMKLVMDITDIVIAGADYAGFQWIRTENAPIFSSEHLKEGSKFFSLLTFTFRGMAQ